MDRHRTERLIDRHGSPKVVGALGEFITPARRARIERVLAGRMGGVHVALEAPSDPHNAAAVVRTAEALGVLGVHVIAAEGNALHAKGATQGAFHWVDTFHHEDLEGFLAAMGEDGRSMYGAWMDAPMPVGAIPIDAPCCIILGNESRGLSDAARLACTSGYHIPMVGMSESLNLSVCAAISLHDVLARRRAAVGPGDLGDAAKDRLRARYFIGSVDHRLLVGLLGAQPDGAQEGDGR